MNLTIRRFNSSVTVFFDALINGLLYSLIPYILFMATGLVKGGAIANLFIYLSVLIFLVVFIFQFLDNRVNQLSITDKEIIYKHTSWGRIITSSVDIEKIKYILVAPSASWGGVRLTISGNNPLDSFVTEGYSLTKMHSITEHLNNVNNQANTNLNIDNQVKVSPKRVLKVILVLSSIIIGVSVLAIVWMVLNSR